MMCFFHLLGKAGSTSMILEACCSTLHLPDDLSRCILGLMPPPHAFQLRPACFWTWNSLHSSTGRYRQPSISQSYSIVIAPVQSISRSRIPKRLRSLRRCAATHVASEVEKVVWNSGAVLDMCKDMPCCLPRLSTCWRHASTMDLTLRSGMLRRTVTILTLPCLLNVVDFVLTISCRSLHRMLLRQGSLAWDWISTVWM